MRTHHFLAAAVAALAAAGPGVAGQHEHHAPADAAPAVAVADVARPPSDLPGPLARRGPETVRVDLETVEVTGQLADGSTYRYWTFNRRVPGPFIRVRVGDTVEVNLSNHADSAMAHNVDFHAVTGPGGGAVATLAAPGESKGFSFRALNPGLYVYHCATPMVAQHIANGMYGLILVEPEEGLPAVDREYYVMQGEIYTEQPFGTPGELSESIDKLLAEQPEYMVFNGTADALVRNPLQADVGETVRIFFGVGGPNRSSSFHVIGEIFDRAWPLAGLSSAPMTDVQTILVPPGGAAVTDFRAEVPGRYILVDHALSRLERGLAGHLVVDGAERADLYRPHQPVDAAASGH
jgi:nitrite reductase (NO-forming)